MSESCYFCAGPVNPHDEGTYKQVTGWVHGKKRDSMTLREDTNKYAHQHCVIKAKGGNAPDQPDLFGDDKVREVTTDTNDRLFEEVFDTHAPPPTIEGLGRMLGLVKPDKSDDDEIDKDLPF